MDIVDNQHAQRDADSPGTHLGTAPESLAVGRLLGAVSPSPRSPDDDERHCKGRHGGEGVSSCMGTRHQLGKPTKRLVESGGRSFPGELDGPPGGLHFDGN